MFIELTDHLRCPAEHAESYLVLIPHLMEGRQVARGTLGCPVCQAEYPIREGVAELGEPPHRAGAATRGPSPMTADGLVALLGLEGAGGFVALAGPAGRLAGELSRALPGVHCVAINPGEALEPSAGVSVVRSARWPLKARSMRGVVIAGLAADDAAWRDAARQSALPGLRVVGEGPPPAGDLLASAGGWWVARG
jgi:uncharacterized protein YbaR (Trm112 family)